MTAIYRFSCSKCDFTCPEFPREARFVVRVYDFGQNRIAPLLRRQAWCRHCKLLTQAERIPSLADIEKQIASYKKVLLGQGKSDGYALALKALAEKYVAYTQLWKEWATSHSYRQGNCLDCGNCVDTLPACGANDAGETYLHPGCGGTLSLSRVVGAYTEKRDGPEVLRYSPDGLAMAKAALPQTAASPQPEPVPAKTRILRQDKETTLHRSPFWLLGAHPQSTRQRIAQLVEERSLELEYEICQKAGTSLTNPSARLAFEVAWLPGVSTVKAVQLMDCLTLDPLSISMENGLPPLAQANLMAAACELLDMKLPTDEMVKYIEEFAYVVERIAVEDVRRDINSDRLVADFQEIRTEIQLEEELEERRLHFRNAMESMLDRFPTESLVEIVTRVVGQVTEHGARRAPALIEALVDNYETESQNFLNKEKENIQKLVQAIRASIAFGEAEIEPLVVQLERVVRNWEEVARPIWLSAVSRGMAHKLSVGIIYQMYSLAVELLIEPSMLAMGARIIKLLKESFSELPELFVVLSLHNRTPPST
ncbi:MAG: hypothetical protein V4634_21865 [Pseudomonadota bacterium]